MNIIFIDANIYLRFYDSNKVYFKELLDKLLEIKDSIFLTRQIANEVERNKLNVFSNSISNYKKNLELKNVALPQHFTDESNKFDIVKWNNARKEIEEKNVGLTKEIEEFFIENNKKISF
ncbi:MAG TPA: PIN-like domain-containing protein, partial [Puia sp.]|nr:PIN-like domain-containing protein [Puia sp.]